MHEAEQQAPGRRCHAANRRLAIVCREGSQVHRLLALVGPLETLTAARDAPRGPRTDLAPAIN